MMCNNYKYPHSKQLSYLVQFLNPLLWERKECELQSLNKVTEKIHCARIYKEESINLNLIHILFCAGPVFRPCVREQCSIQTARRGREERYSGGGGSECSRTAVELPYTDSLGGGAHLYGNMLVSRRLTVSVCSLWLHFMVYSQALICAPGQMLWLAGQRGSSHKLCLWCMNRSDLRIPSAPSCRSTFWNSTPKSMPSASTQTRQRRLRGCYIRYACSSNSERLELYLNL